MYGSVRSSLPLLLLLALGALVTACATAVTQQATDGGNTCNDNSDCMSGYHCENQQCVPNLDGGVVPDGGSGGPPPHRRSRPWLRYVARVRRDGGPGQPR